MEITAFVTDRSDEAGLKEYVELKLAAFRADQPHDPEPTHESLVGFLFTPLPYYGTCEYWAARQDGRMVGLLTVGFHSDENSHLVVAEVVLHPDVRGRGIETSLLTAALPTVRDRGRSIVTFQGVTEGSSVDSWARGLGFAVVHRDLLQRLDLVTTDPARWQVPAPAGYRAQRWIGSTPEELIDSYAAVRTAIGDQPQQEWSVQWPAWTAQRVRDDEKQLREHGDELLVVGAVDESTNQVAGVTEITLYPHRPERAIQGYTAVLPEHRGHGLGLFAKAHMMRWLRQERPHVVEAMASNADDNTYMLNINKRLGYLVRREMVTFELSLDKLTARVA
jgi:GNAT superfamily N-acetyltransferase